MFNNCTSTAQQALQTVCLFMLHYTSGISTSAISYITRLLGYKHSVADPQVEARGEGRMVKCRRYESRGAEGTEGVVREEGVPPPRKFLDFLVENDVFWCILLAIFAHCSNLNLY